MPVVGDVEDREEDREVEIFGGDFAHVEEDGLALVVCAGLVRRPVFAVLRAERTRGEGSRGEDGHGPFVEIP